MGLGYRYKCSECSKKYEVFQGIGMLFPEGYEDTVAKLKNGRFGKAWKELYENTENVAIDAEKRVYLCPSCGYWKNEPGLSLYAADNEEAISAVKNGCPVFYGDDSLPAMMGNMPKYHLLKEYEHKCKKCGGKMKAADDDEMLTLSCPNAAEHLILRTRCWSFGIRRSWVCWWWRLALSGSPRRARKQSV